MTQGRVVLVGLLFWGLLMIVPDLARVVRPLHSLGFFADSNGLIYDTTGAFDRNEDSPAWKAGIREGDRLDLSRMRCFPYDHATCASTLASVGGNLYVPPGQPMTIHLLATPDQPAREVTIEGERRPSNWYVRLIILLDEMAGIAVLLAAAWLVWIRPGPMSWGFFLYVLWFNPGQSFEFYSLLLRWPAVLLTQEFLGCIAQAAGFVGLLLFAVRAPSDVPQPEWQWLERALPAIAAVIALALMASYGVNFGFETELWSRITILFGLAVSLAAVVILLVRRRSLSAKENQRLTWVLWGALIGLPAVVIADLSGYTTFFANSWIDFDIPEDAAGLLYLINGVLCLFVFEAIRRERVVSVTIPLRRVTLLALTMSVPAMFLHREAEHLQEVLDVPQWVWFLIAAAIVFVIGQLHHWAVELADHFFNRALDSAEIELGEKIVNAKDAAEIDRQLSAGALGVLKLASAATFRRDGARYKRFEDGAGWTAGATTELSLGDNESATLASGKAITIDQAEAPRIGLPTALETPILAVPSTSRKECYAVTLYGPHESGTDIDSNERHVLESLARLAADAYAGLETAELRRLVAKLSDQLQAATSAAASAAASASAPPSVVKA